MGKACWGCKHLETQEARNEDGYPTSLFYCRLYNLNRGYVGRLMEGCIRPNTYMGKDCHEDP
jgi:hypothetical protein